MQANMNENGSCQLGLLSTVYGDPNNGVLVTKLLIKSTAFCDMIKIIYS